MKNHYLNSKAKNKKRKHKNRIRQIRNIKNKTFTIVCYICIAFGISILSIILITLIIKGHNAFNINLLTKNLPAVGMSGGGIKNAIIGSAILSLTAIAISAPIGILIATYLTEFKERNYLSQIIQFSNDILLSTPSIIVGLFVYSIIVLSMGKYSAIAGIIALSILAIPMVIRTTEDIIKMVPKDLREAAVSLGVKRSTITFNIIYKVSKKGMITGIILALARISGETAPLLFTSLNNQFASINLLGPIANLPVMMYQYAMSPYKVSQNLAWAAALIIVLGILILNIISRFLFKTKKTN